LSKKNSLQEQFEMGGNMREVLRSASSDEDFKFVKSKSKKEKNDVA